VRSEDEALHTCPTCGTKVVEAKLGLRDYATWVDGALPGKVGPTDIDALIHQAKTGRALVMEFKPRTASLPKGQRLVMQHLAEVGMDVWVIWDQGDGNLNVCALRADGELSKAKSLTNAGLADAVRSWWEKGLV
jgi:hypothetical protein